MISHDFSWFSAFFVGRRRSYEKRSYCTKNNEETSRWIEGKNLDPENHFLAKEKISSKENQIFQGSQNSGIFREFLVFVHSSEIFLDFSGYFKFFGIFQETRRYEKSWRNIWGVAPWKSLFTVWIYNVANLMHFYTLSTEFWYFVPLRRKWLICWAG